MTDKELFISNKNKLRWQREVPLFLWMSQRDEKHQESTLLVLLL
jgi:hypothetical protein